MFLSGDWLKKKPSHLSTLRATEGLFVPQDPNAQTSAISRIIMRPKAASFA